MGVENHRIGRIHVRSDVPEQEDTSDLTPRFKLIFLTVAALTVLAMILNVLLAMFGGDTEQVRAAAETCSTASKMGFGAVVGLIGGRSS